jgi:hypothetical protein
MTDTPNPKTGATQVKEDESLNSFWWRHHLQSIQTVAQTFGVGLQFFKVLVLYTLWREWMMLSMQLDTLFFPAWRGQRVERPVFIIGHPRSGTTMLHRSLTSADDFVVFKFWHLLFPSLTSRKLVGPLMDDLIRKGKDVIVPKTVGHLFSLGAVDE